METKTWENVINIPYGQVTITYKNDSNYRYANTTYNLYLTFTNPIAKGGYIALNLNGAFTTIPSKCVINSGIDFSDIGNVKCENVVGDAKTILRVHGFKEVNA